MPSRAGIYASEACTGGAGGTRTHGRRIMSPLRILATLADQCRFPPFLQVRHVHLCQPCAVLVGWFLSLWSQRGSCRSLRDLPHTESRTSLQLNRRGPTMAQRIPLPALEALTPEVWVADDVSFPKCGTASVGGGRRVGSPLLERRRAWGWVSTTPGAGFCDGAVRRVLGRLTREPCWPRGVHGRRGPCGIRGRQSGHTQCRVACV